ncbi:MAG: DUF2189 domain-containing protein [Rhodospirillaceae bacterium]|jgi:uncharacterized membrane protein|nr:DUF2189 domain-containing protein [Rhodospirillaceae bacterium]MBT4220092.1 DUF2189 domain-containing protein [Rhodospirillaceae bacterium]MBT4463748.1 DUF2189 domain-containing protein [Rhodospirillaceae bacterium]MBT5013670.1 DUF2189 domain-containing protein [Rhodospirillaceae bacterium]MBT5308162.1 DUF2189 domain-containing protein [Rhodospirillaceae bacterium]
MSDSEHSGASKKIVIRKVDMDAPWRWLIAGWHDFLAAPLFSLVYGSVFALVGYGLTWGLLEESLFHFLLPLASGFMLLGPLFAVGLYNASHRLEQGEPVSFGHCWLACRRNLSQIALMGLALMLFMLIWVRVATLIYALFFSERTPGLDGFLLDTLLSAESLPFLIVGTLSGAVLAIGVFAVSVISIPMLMDRDIDALQAIITSIQAVQMNFKTMWGWACLIGLFTGAGLVLFYVGLVITLPLIGYASWHAYRDLVEPES